MTCTHCGQVHAMEHVCGCVLCGPCIGGIVSRCPHCFAEVPMTRVEMSERREGDWSGWLVVAGALALAVMLLVVAR